MRTINFLSEDEFSLLTKVLSFVPTRTKTSQQEIHKTWGDFKKHILKLYFFWNSIHEKPSPFKRRSNWIPPPLDNPTLTEFFTSIEQELNSISTPRQKTYSNLTLTKKTGLNKFRNYHSIIIKPCDKGGGICIMNTRDSLQSPYTSSRPQEIQTTFPQPNQCNRPRCRHFHTLYAFPTHKRYNHHGISTTSKQYSDTSILWVTKNKQAKLPSPPYCLRM